MTLESEQAAPKIQTPSLPRVGLVLPYWPFWERAYPGDLRETRVELGRAIGQVLPGFGFVPVIVEADPRTVPLRLPTNLDAILVASSMAVPPAWVFAALEDAAGVPLVIWAVQRQGTWPGNFSPADITADGAAVGTPQITSLLTRAGRPFLLAAGPVDSPKTQQQVSADLRAAVCATAIRRARIGRVGDPLPGYDCVDCPDEALEDALHATVIRFRHAELVTRYQVARPQDIALIRQETCTTFDVDPTVWNDVGLERSLRLAAALESLDSDHNLSCGTLNCHVEEFRLGPEPGISACFALGRETSRGTPWTCTGDVLAALAMFTAKRLTGTAMYHEIEMLDYETDEALLANTGEHDIAWLDPVEPKPSLRLNPWFQSDPQCGVCACLGCAPGAATLVGFVYDPHESSGFRFVAAEGTITSRAIEETGTMHAAFSFGSSREEIGTAWSRWVRSGVHHHSAAARGHIANTLQSLAVLLGLGFTRVS